MDNENGKLLVQASKRTKYYLKTARKTVLLSKGLTVCARPFQRLACPDELLIKRGPASVSERP